MKNFLEKLRANRTVLKRTKNIPGLPKLAIYVEWLSGQFKRRVIDELGQSYDIDDNIMQSAYKMVTGGQARVLIGKYWSALQQAASEAVSAVPKPKAKAPAAKKEKAPKAVKKSAAKKPAATKAATKKTAAKKAATKKPATKKAPAKKTVAKKAATKKATKKKTTKKKA